MRRAIDMLTDSAAAILSDRQPSLYL